MHSKPSFINGKNRALLIFLSDFMAIMGAIGPINRFIYPSGFPHLTLFGVLKSENIVLIRPKKKKISD